MDARVARLEAHVEYMRGDIGDLKTDMKELRSDVTAIKHRLAYLAGGAVVAVGIFVWIANNRFDQIIKLVTQ